MLFSKKSKAMRELAEGRDWKLPTSMIDVVFLLLIFFMCASKFRVLEQRLDAFLPKKDGPGDGVEFREELVIKVDALRPALRVPRFRIRGWATHDPNELAGHLARLERIGEYRIVIDGRKDCPFQHMMSALDACARAGQRNVGFLPPPHPRRG